MACMIFGLKKGSRVGGGGGGVKRPKGVIPGCYPKSYEMQVEKQGSSCLSSWGGARFNRKRVLDFGESARKVDSLLGVKKEFVREGKINLISHKLGAGKKKGPPQPNLFDIGATQKDGRIQMQRILLRQTEITKGTPLVHQKKRSGRKG